MKITLNKIIVISAFIFALIVSVMHYKTGRNITHSDTVYSEKVETLWRETTIVEKEFVPKIVKKLKIDTVYKDNGDTMHLVTESKMFQKTVISEKDTADVNIYTSGIQTSLDSLKMRFKTHKEIVTNTVEITNTVEKKKTFMDRIHIQPQVTGGWGLIHNQFDITVGVGIGIDI